MKAFPYRRPSGTVSLRVDAVCVKAPEQPREQLDARARSVVERVVALGLAETEDWETATLTVSATIPSKVTEPAGPWSDAMVVAVLTDRTTNTRVTAGLAPEAEGGREWCGDLQVLRADLFDRAALTVQVVATVDGVPGRIIAEAADDWIVDVRSDTPTREQSLDVKELGFTKGPRWLQKFTDAPWIVNASGNLPTVYINTDFEGMTDILGAEGRGPEGLVNELMVAQMAADVWIAVFHSAIGDLEMEDDGTPLFPHGWQGEVLREMLPDVAPDRNLEDALREVHRGRVGATGWTELQPRIQYAAMRRAAVPRALSETVHGLDKLKREDEA
ncbi:hypothetical protein [Streptomyces acidiscabies]|uniref:Uncharacterized protein n=1 Tax=Streptomyces acidiscabies TaxID=42234 RepID=A0AAP6B7I4_9ACTN|nr:hypothetical protein [Streptomyces acidiscabies]MBP5939389.1 hypothetical protein [Streptomyces sp. LBUM 1476]MBZ3910529.1 hypothetical protein [Streptomyces acidiscabies]MDX2959529.1 hypothetical protein [Streptomyces acidiscabies]MDX3019183.1 hypothetical protein [Streptomyces acidiscabies]MDX3790736.1 hypothetical protein [Streptomyces acidiscabies]